MPDSPADTKTALQAEMLYNRLTKRFRHLRKWARRTGTGAYRLYDRDIPEIPLVLDVYGENLAGALYKRPYEKDPQEEALWLAAMAAAASRAADIPEDSIFIKQRERQRGKSQYERIQAQGVFRDVSEGGLLFRVNLSDYLDTGLFLDHRKTRSMVRDTAAGKRVLNLFCYTASFSVYAAAGGAAGIDSVDLSNTYLDWGMVNFKLNGFDAEKITPEQFTAAGRRGKPYRFIRGDGIRFLREAAAAGLRWDLIILDPPTFSNSKKMSGTLDIRRDYRELTDRCLTLLSPAGTLWFSTNARNFTLDPGDFPGFTVRDMKKATLDEDFRGKSHRSCYTFTYEV
ncbi:class I SAM-dependent methyltransferase [Breznakiella homolactica]|uniref:Class I SAM-dependent methyltransferase n=1 Tax=Breznakiella homolactica TaxID=2798577 RepID=A0A7T7XL98_9SPIR|nr:class I SAM-dependent methyltransferase [Breznakiella homolactica]QQO08381.1 class I SAM-dependent methyltransferase [Breznakiella homolactica]